MRRQKCRRGTHECVRHTQIKFVEGPRSRSIYPHDRGDRFLTRNGVGPVLYRRSIHRTQTLAAYLGRCSWSIQLSSE